MLAVLVFLLECPKAAFFTLEYSGESTRDLAKMEMLIQQEWIRPNTLYSQTFFQVLLLVGRPQFEWQGPITPSKVFQSKQVQLSIRCSSRKIPVLRPDPFKQKLLPNKALSFDH